MKGMDTIPKGDDADDISKGIENFAGHYETFFMTMSDVSRAGRIGIDDQIHNDLQADKADLDVSGSGPSRICLSSLYSWLQN